jgi:enoyl-CoA hydratase
MREEEASDDVLIQCQGRAGRITMNRPQALNALTYPMVGRIFRALSAWREDASVALVVIDGAGGKALCAGGDVRALYASRDAGSAAARAFWSEEYRLNALIARYPKPCIAVQDGIVMGGGIGLSAHARHRIVTERSRLAMPETGIGLIPDVGATFLLARAPGACGTYLGLTGQAMSGADAIYAGFADVFVPATRIAGLIACLADADGGSPADIVRAAAEHAGPVRLAELRDAIDGAFAASSVEEIVAALHHLPGEWAAATAAALAHKSPKALKLAHAAIGNARSLTLEQALAVEYRLAVRLFEDGEFPEGVRALLIDKDRAPRWRPPRLAEMGPELVAGYLAPLAANEELGL